MFEFASGHEFLNLVSTSYVIRLIYTVRDFLDESAGPNETRTVPWGLSTSKFKRRLLVVLIVLNFGFSTEGFVGFSIFVSIQRRLALLSYDTTMAIHR